MNVKARKAKKQVNVENQAINLLSKEELNKKIEVVEKELRSYTWRELETNGENDEGLKDPVIEEEFDPDRTILSLSLEKKQAIKTSDNVFFHCAALRIFIRLCFRIL